MQESNLIFPSIISENAWIVQNMMFMQRMMYGGFAPPTQFFMPPNPEFQPIETATLPPLPVEEYHESPPPPPPSDVMLATSPVSSVSTFYDGLHEEAQHPPSPSMIVNYSQNGQQWFTPPSQEFNDDDINIDPSEISTIEFDIDEFLMGGGDEDQMDSDDDDVVFVGEYQRSADVSPMVLGADVVDPAPEPMDHQPLMAAEARAVVAEERVRELEQILEARIRSTSCVICMSDFLQAPTLRLGCGHLGCAPCVARLENAFEDTRCPYCRTDFVSTRFCERVYFH